ncbi:DUF3857 domain-containing protein [Ekhidna sp.]|uniref:DUF3857 domain-containing protein n=1 Tax=Ekhidna sp. TaxID=2608089 RepID=UPI003B502A51
MKYSLALLFSLLILSSTAQKTSKKFGQFTQYEIDLQKYEKDLKAEAVVLFDIGKSKFIDTPEGGYNIEFTRTRRIKVFSDNLAEEHKTVSIPFYEEGYGKTEKIKSIEAYTVHIENGIPVPKKVRSVEIYEERINNNWKVKKFIFPDVREGAFLEYKYTIETPFVFNLPDWEFQSTIPTMYSEYEVRMITFYEYVFLVQGVSKFDHQKSYIDKKKRTWGSVAKSYGQNVSNGVEFQDYVHIYGLEDIPAFNDEAYITSINDYIVKIDFQLAKINYPTGGNQEIVTTWPELISDMSKNEAFGKYIKASKKYAKKVVTNLKVDGKSDLEKAEIAINYVKNNFNWNGFNDKYAPNNPKELHTKKEGNSAEINLFLVALLDELGIETKPVILSTRNHGKIKMDYPFKHFFNYVIVLVNVGQPYLTDATEPFLPYNQIPSKCFNDKGLIISDNGVDFVDLRSQQISLKKTTIRINELDLNNSKAKTTLNIQTNGYEALGLKNRYSDRKTDLLSNLSNDVLTLASGNTLNYKSQDKPYVMELDGSCSFESAGDNIIFKPFLNLPLQTNGLTQKTRSYPVDFTYPFSEVYESNISLPTDYSVSELPENLSIKNDLAEIELTYSKLEGGIKVVGKYQFKKAVYNANEYARIKFYLDEIVKKFNQEILLEKS